ncbi:MULTISPECIES: Crp/Fnr family transcriptional regulator [unclassified Chryseobacterium]|uniref:Crp/Fnr family transcriptional regulator n=1 Tax=unclassified Chryseobacterium TaxID=2593645 RepID=UPI002269EAE4|nr:MULTISPECIES: Crp/Fnr family transcriptional regulator [unclassified Chryseobacterium]
MVIDEDILHSMGAVIKSYRPSENIFTEGDLPNYYYQIVKGEVKLNNYNEEGKEIIQGLMGKGQSIEESLLFINKVYPVNAVAIISCEILKLPKFTFLEILKLYPEICFDLFESISQRLYFKLIMAQNLCTQNPAHKLISLMDYLKSSEEEQSPYSFQVPLTRQQMASITGLCVETVIRSLKKMEKDNRVQIENRKILY